MCNWNQDYSIILWKDYLFQERRKKKISLIWDTCDVSVEGVADFGKCGAVTLTCLCPWVKRSAKKSLGQTSLTVQEAKINSSATPWELLTAFWGQGKVQWPKESWALEISVPLDSPPRLRQYGARRSMESIGSVTHIRFTNTLSLGRDQQAMMVLWKLYEGIYRKDWSGCKQASKVAQGS